MGAWDILKDENDTLWIICQFNHPEHTVDLALWRHPVELGFVRVVMPLPAEKTVPLKDVESMEVVFKW